MEEILIMGQGARDTPADLLFYIDVWDPTLWYSQIFVVVTWIILKI